MLLQHKIKTIITICQKSHIPGGTSPLEQFQTPRGQQYFIHRRYMKYEWVMVYVVTYKNKRNAIEN